MKSKKHIDECLYIKEYDGITDSEIKYTIHCSAIQARMICTIMLLLKGKPWKGLARVTAEVRRNKELP